MALNVIERLLAIFVHIGLTVSILRRCQIKEDLGQGSHAAIIGGGEPWCL